MNCRFVVGQKVEMIEPFKPSALERAREENVTLPVTGTIYTVRDMEPGEGWNAGKVFLRFNELVNDPHVGDGIEPSFCSSMFRAVVERKTDISIFEAMLTPSKQRVPA